MRSTSLSASRRAGDLEALAAGDIVDVLVIGGGVTGAGVALDAASRGLTVALLERRDLAFGTSRWSSKLVHGGLRYLARGQVALAAESARERGVLMERTAPHLTRALPFVIPLNDDLRAGAGCLAQGLTLAGDGLRTAARTSPGTLPRPRRISAGQARRLAPGLRPDGLRGALLCWDGQLVDDARLVVALARTAAGLGARIVTYCSVSQVTGTSALAHDELGGGAFEVRARAVVNATGVWAGTLDPTVRLRPSRGAHLVVPAERLGHPLAATMAPIPGASARWVLTVPVGDGRALVGLTDTPVEGPLPDVPTATSGDVAFLLATINRALATPLEHADVLGTFAGLRPLLAGADGPTADLSRRHRCSRRGDGMLTLVGGKLTTYRRMAQQAVDMVCEQLGHASRPCRTAALPLVGAADRRRLATVRAPRRLVARYGTEAPAVAALAGDHPSLLEPVAPGLATLGVEFLFGISHEGALTVADLLERRTRLGLVAADAEAAAPLARALLEHAPTA